MPKVPHGLIFDKSKFQFQTQTERVAKVCQDPNMEGIHRALSRNQSLIA